MRVVINLNPPRGRMTVSPTWTMSVMEKAKAFPDRKRMVDRVLHFELTPGNVAYAKSAFKGAEIYGEPTAEKSNLVSGPRMNFKTSYQPKPLQVEALARARGKKLFAFFEKPGAGKTKICLDHCVDLWCAGEIDGVFILSYAGVHEQWILDEIPKHIHPDIPLSASAWSTSKKFDMSFLRPDPNRLRILAMNYESYATSDRGLALAHQFSETGCIAAVADESQRIKSEESRISELAVNNRERWGARFIASGEPTPLGIEDYYKQFCFLDPGIIGCWTYEGFKGMYCRMSGDHRKIIGYHNQDRLHKLMAPHVHVGAPEIDAEQIFKVSRFELGRAAREAHEELKQDMMVLLDETLKITARADVDVELLAQSKTFQDDVFYRLRNAIAMQGKLNEITCGRVTNQLGEIMKLGNERQEHLNTLLDLNGRHKLIIWSVFKADHQEQAEMLGSAAGVYNGDTPKPRRREIVKEFLERDSSMQYLIASKAAAGTGLNLQGTCFRNIYYSDNSNAGQRWQSEHRTYRLGVDRDVLYTDVIARNSVNVGIHNSNKRKKDVSTMSAAELMMLIQEEDILEL